MRKRKGSLLQRMMAVLLTAVLMTGMAAGAVPAEVRADGNKEIPASVSGNTTEPIEEETASEPVAEPETKVEETQPQADRSIASGEGWVLDKDGVLTIESDAGMRDWFNVGWHYYSDVRQAVIRSGVTKIDSYAFEGCSSLESIEIPSGVAEIGSFAFRGCSSLKNIEIPSSVTELWHGMFEGCSSLESIEIPSGVTEIRPYAFEGCSSLKNIEIPSGVTEIGPFAFEGCSSLESIEIPSGVTELWLGMFEGCSSLESIEIPSSVAKIGSYAFRDCSSLKSIEIPSGITEMRDGAFEGCSSLTSVTMLGKTPPVLLDTDCEVFESCKFVTDGTRGIQVPEGCAAAYKTTWANWKDYIKPGRIEIGKEQGEDTPGTKFGTSKDDLIRAVLTPEEKSLVAAGTDVKITLAIDNIDASVSPSDQQAVTEAAVGYNVGQYLDINLYKMIGADGQKLLQTNGKIRIVLTIPNSLRNVAPAKTRSFAVVRVHNGEAELLADFDNDEATITIATYLFSTYALVYKDTANTDGNAKDNELKTGNATPIEICAILAMAAGLFYLIRRITTASGKR